MWTLRTTRSPQVSLWLGLAIAFAAASVAACDGGPAGPDELALVDQPGESTGSARSGGELAAGPGVIGEDSKLTLEYLLKQAIDKIAREQGHEAAKAVLETLAKLNTDVQVARKAGNKDTFYTASAALRAAQLGIVLRTLGTGTALHVVDAVAQALAEVSAQVAAARAAGKDVARIEAALRDVAGLLEKARAALGAGDHAAALDLGTHAGALVAQLRHATSVADGSYVVIPTLEKLLAEALHKIATEQGRDAAKELSAQLDPLQAALRTAKESQDREAFLAAQTALRSAQLRIVVAVLGAEALRQVVGAATKVLADINTKIAAAKAAGKDVSKLEPNAQRAGDLLARATAAAAAGDVHRALDLATQAGELIEGLRRSLGHL